MHTWRSRIVVGVIGALWIAACTEPRRVKTADMGISADEIQPMLALADSASRDGRKPEQQY